MHNRAALLLISEVDYIVDHLGHRCLGTRIAVSGGGFNRWWCNCSIHCCGAAVCLIIGHFFRIKVE